MLYGDRGSAIPLCFLPKKINMLDTNKNKRQVPKIVMATVFLKSKTGRSLLGKIGNVPGEPEQYMATTETFRKAISELKQRGFTIEAEGVTLSISGLPEQFEQSCGIKISCEEKIIFEPGKTQPRTQLVYRASKPVMQIQGLENIIEGIVLAIPGVPFENC